MTEKFLVCAIVFFILTLGFCVVIGALLKWADNKSEWLRATVSFVITALCLFGIASFLELFLW